MQGRVSEPALKSEPGNGLSQSVPEPVRVERDPEFRGPVRFKGQDREPNQMPVIFSNKNFRSGNRVIEIEPAPVTERIIEHGKFQRVGRPGLDEGDIVRPERAEGYHG